MPIQDVAPTEIPPSAVLLDVREDDEWVAGHAPQARHIPMSDVPDRITELAKDDTVVAICRAGGRSSRVAAYLQAQGYDVLNLDGGMQAWAAAHQPMVSETGAPPEVI